jgi:hypothetical protein
LVLGCRDPVEAVGAHCQPQARTWERPDSGAVTS